MAKNTKAFVQDFAFYEQLWEYYSKNRGKIRSRYNDLTKKFLAYNDSNENSDAFLREPQFEALEMYVFVKEFMDNAHMYQMFDEWRKRENRFSDASYYTIHKGGQGTLLDMGDEQNEIVFKQMKKYKEDYPNYIYALTMGLGKTILMATCIFYEFLLAKKYPKDKRFCHNALVFAPDKTVLESLREIMTFDKTKVVPPEYAHVLDQNIKFHFLEGTGITLHTIDDSDFNIVISNNQKIIVKKKRKADTPTDILFGSGSLLEDIYGNDDDDSKPEKECFLQYISSNKVKEIYFTGMFTSNQGDLSVQYYDPESKRLRKYYPDFLALMEDGSYQLIEVKGDNKIDDEVVLAKKAAAEEMAVASGIHYLMYAGSTLMKSNVLEPTLVVQQASIDI